MAYRPLRVGFQSDGAANLVKNLNAASKAQLSYARSLPTKQMASYRKEINASTRELSKNIGAQERFSNILIQTELQAKNARLGFTQFKKALQPNELRKFGTEIGKLDHILGSVNRTLRVSNQQLADRGFNQKTLGQVQSRTKRYVKDLSNIRKALDGAFESKQANAFIASLSQIDSNLKSIERVSRELRRFEIPLLGRGGVNIPKLSRDFRFPNELEEESRIKRLGIQLNRRRGLIDSLLSPSPSDRQGRLDTANRRLLDIDRTLAPLVRAEKVANVNLQTIKKGTEASLSVIEEQIELHSQLASLGSADSSRRLGELTRQRDFILQNIKIREREALIATQNLSLARAKTDSERESLKVARDQIKQFGIQRSILDDVLNVRNQIRRVLQSSGGIQGGISSPGNLLKEFAGVGSTRSGDVLAKSDSESFNRFIIALSRLTKDISKESVRLKGALRNVADSAAEPIGNFFRRVRLRGESLGIRLQQRYLRASDASRSVQGQLSSALRSIGAQISDSVSRLISSSAGQAIRAQEARSRLRFRLGRALGSPVETTRSQLGRLNDAASLQFVKLNNSIERLGSFISELSRGRVSLSGGRTFGLTDRSLAFRRSGKFISDSEVGVATRRFLRGIAVAIRGIDPRNILRGQIGQDARERFRGALGSFSYKEFRVPGDQIGGRLRGSLREISSKSAQSVSKYLQNSFKSAEGMTKEFVKSVRLQERLRVITQKLSIGVREIITGVRRVADGFREWGRRGREFLNITENARRAFVGIAKGIASADYRNLINIGINFKDAISEIRRPGGFADIFRSADVQIERIEGRLRELGRELVAPTERIKVAQSEFNLLEAKTQASLATIDKRIGDLLNETDNYDSLTERLETLQTDSKGLKLELDLQKAFIDEVRRPLRRELDFLTNDINEVSVNLFKGIGDGGGSEYETATLTLKELREEVEKTQSSLETLSAKEGKTLQDVFLVDKEKQNLTSLRNQLDPIDQRISYLRDNLRKLRDVEFENTKDILASQDKINRITAETKKSIFDAENSENARLQALKTSREVFENSLDVKREELKTERLQFNVVKEQIEQERTLLGIRKDRLNVRKETGAGSDTVFGALGDLGRNVQSQRNLKGLIGELDDQREIGEETALATERLSGLTSELSQAQSAIEGFGNASLASAIGASELNNQFGIGQEDINAYAQSIADANDEIEQVDLQQQGIINSLKGRISSIITNPVDTALSVVKNATLTVGALAETVVTRTLSTANYTARSLARLTTDIIDGIAQIPVKLIGVIPFVGEGLQGLAQIAYDTSKNILSNVSNIALGIAHGFASVIKSIFSSVYDTVKSVIVGIGNVAESVLRGTLGRIKSIADALVNSVLHVFSRLRDLYISAVAGVLDSVRRIFTRVFDGIQSRVVDAFETIRKVTLDIAGLSANIIAAPFRLIAKLITDPFRTLKKIILDIGNLITSAILLPIRPIVSLLSLPIRALGRVLNAFNYSYVPETTNNLKVIQEEGKATTESIERVSGHYRRATGERKQRNKEYITNVHTVRRQADATADSLTKNLRGINDIFRILTQGADNLATSVSSLHSGLSNLALGAAGFLAIFGGVLAAGKRADAYKGIILAFEQTGIALDKLSDASGRTIRDIGAMQAANVALSNTPELVRKAFAEQASGITESSHKSLQAYKEVLGDGVAGSKSGIVGLMEIARAQAIRTGESTSFLFQSLTSGVKRSSPKLIDNTGIVIKIGQANEKFAEALGKTVGELSATDKQLALLAETVRAGMRSIGQITKETEGARQKFERFKSVLGDIADRLTFGLQPALESTLDFFNELGFRVKDASVVIATGLYAGSTVFIEGFGTLFGSLFSTIGSLASSIRQIMTDLFNSVGIDITTIAVSSSDVLTQVVSGAASVFGGVAGVIAGVFHAIVDTVRSSLEAIAGMLIGQSPPPEGPLRELYTGARKAFESWEEGFTSTGTVGISGYAQNLSDAFSFILQQGLIGDSGDIVAETFAKAEAAFGNLSAREIKNRIAGLDAAFKPFEERLNAVRKHFDAIRESAQFAKDAISRRIDSLLQDVIDGSAAAAAQVRQLDAIHGRIVAGNRLEQQRLENAAIGIELAKARTAEERALLELLLSQKTLEEGIGGSGGSGGGGGSGGRGRVGRSPRVPKAPSEKAPTGGSPIEDPFEDLRPDLQPLSGTFAGFLLPDYENVINSGRLAFESAFKSASTFTSGQAGLGYDDPFAEEVVSTADKPTGNIFERFFDSLGDTIRGGPEQLQESITAAFQDIKDRIAESSTELAANVQIVWNVVFGELPRILSSFIDALASPAGLNDWFAQNSASLENIGAIDFNQDGKITLGEVVFSILNIKFKFASDVANAWTEYVERVNNSLANEGESRDPNISPLDRTIALLFNDDFTLNIQAPLKFLFSYVTGTGDAAKGTSLGADLEAWWNDGAGLVETVEGIISAAGNIVKTAVGNAVSLVVSLANVAISVFIDPETLSPTNIANLISFAARAALGVVAFPLLIAEYLGTTPIGDISLAGVVAKIIGIDELELTNLPSEINHFLTVTLPAQLDDAFGEGNIATALLGVANTIRSRIHEVLFGESLLPSPNQLPPDVSSGSNVTAQKGLVRAFIDRLKEIPKQISDFLDTEEGKNIFNLHRIFVALGLITEDTSLKEVWEGIVVEFTGFLKDPLGYLVTKLEEAFSGFKDGIVAFLSGDNPITAGLNAIGEFFSGNETFNVGTIASDFFAGVDSFARDLRAAFGISTIGDFIAQGLTPGEADNAFQGQASRSVIDVIISQIGVLRDSIVADITNNPQNYSLIDSVLGALFNTTLKGIVNPDTSGGSGGENEQTAKFLDTVSNAVFGRPLAEVPAFFTGLPEKLLEGVAGKPPEGTSRLDHIVSNLFDQEGLTAADLIPNLLTSIRRIPQAIIDALAQTSDFGTEGFVNVAGVGDVGLGRQFTLAPFFERILGSIRDSAVAFFDDNPIGNAITGAFRWFSGDTDFTAQGFVDGVSEFLAADADGRNQLIRDYLKDNPNLFGITSLVQFFTGNEDWTLEGSFNSLLESSGGAGFGIGNALQRAIDFITGDIRAGAASPLANQFGEGALVSNRGNIFQRLGNKITGAFQSALDSVTTFFNERASAGDNFLGLDTFIEALSGGKYPNVAAWLNSFSEDVAGVDTGKIESFPDLVEKVTTALTNLFGVTQEIIYAPGAGFSGDAKKKSPFAIIFDPDTDGSLAWSLNPENNGIASGIATLREVIGDLPSIVATIESLFDSLGETLFKLRESFSGILGGNREEDLTRYRTRFALRDGDYISLIGGWIPNFSLDNPIVQEELEKAGIGAEQVGSAIFNLQYSSFISTLTSSNPGPGFALGAELPGLLSLLETLSIPPDGSQAMLLQKIADVYGQLGEDGAIKIRQAYLDSLTAPDVIQSIDPSTGEFIYGERDGGIFEDMLLRLVSIPEPDVLENLISGESEEIASALIQAARDVYSGVGNAINNIPLAVENLTGVKIESNLGTNNFGLSGAGENPIISIFNAGGWSTKNAEQAGMNLGSSAGSSLASSFKSAAVAEASESSNQNFLETFFNHILGLGAGRVSASDDQSPHEYANTDFFADYAAGFIQSAQDSINAAIETSDDRVVISKEALEKVSSQVEAQVSGALFDGKLTGGEWLVDALVSAGVTDSELLRLVAFSNPVGLKIGQEILDSIQSGMDVEIVEADIPNLIASLKAQSPPTAGALQQIDTWGESIGDSYRNAILDGMNAAISEDDLSALISTIAPVDAEEGLPSSGPLAGIAEWGRAVGQAWVTSFATPFTEFFGTGGDSGDGDVSSDAQQVANGATGEGESDGGSIGAWSAVLDSAYQASVTFAAKVPTAFATIAGRVWDVFIDPMVKGFNTLIDAFNQFLRNMSQAQNSAVNAGLLIPGVDIESIGFASGISISRPDFSAASGNLPGAATGGTFGAGGLIVGERGPELIIPSERISIFPAHVTRDIARISSVTEGTHTQPIYNNTTYNYDNRVMHDDHSTRINVDARGQSNPRRIAMKMRSARVRGF